MLNRGKKYAIEDANLDGKYKEWQKKLHPDLVYSKSEVCACKALVFLFNQPKKKKKAFEQAT